MLVIAPQLGNNPQAFAPMQKEWDLVIVNSTEQLYAESARPECFGVFLAERFSPDAFGSIKRMRTATKVQVVLMVSKISNQTNLRALEAGAMSILPEPLNPAKILLRARQMLEKYHRESGVDIESLPEKPKPVVAPVAKPSSTYTMVDGKKTGQSGEGSGPAPVGEDGSAAKLLMFVRNSVEELPGDVEFSRDKWDTAMLPGASNKAAGLDDVHSQIRALFEYVRAQLRAGRITLISIRGDEARANGFPQQLVGLIGSEGSFPSGLRMDSQHFTPLAVAFERKKAVFLNSGLPRKVGAQSRPNEFLFGSQSEAALAVLPLTQGTEDVYAAILIQFDKAPDAFQKNLLKEAMAFLNHTETSYRKVDFLSRFYRKLKKTGS